MKRWIPLWAVPLIIGLAVATVWLRLSIVKTTYGINQTEQMITNAKHEKEKASLRLAGLRSPRKLEAVSKSKFNLTQPRAEQVVYIK